jgi:polysaccharide export outer membrane protein
MIKHVRSSLNLFLIFIAGILFSSCADQKNFVYFQRATNGSDSVALAETYVPKIQPEDILSIYVTSLNPAATSYFNPYAGGNVSQEQSNTVGSTYDANAAVRLAREGAPGYRVDEKGNIEVPLVGLIQVAGLSTSQARDLIREKLNTYLKEPTVNVRFLNFKISVMGEVNRPAVYLIANERISVPEAITLAGDLSIYGKRTNVTVIREVNGLKTFGYIDMTSRNAFSSPYYYLHSNDILYVEPVGARSAQTTRTNSLLPIVFSALSLLLVFFQTLR